jgi:hypothetical protein
MVGPVIGFLSDAVMQQIEACLKVVMELSKTIFDPDNKPVTPRFTSPNLP